MIIPDFKELAEESGYGVKAFYTGHEVAAILGTTSRVIANETLAGRMPYFLPRGRKNGRKYTIGGVQEWLDGGAHERTAED